MYQQFAYIPGFNGIQGVQGRRRAVRGQQQPAGLGNQPVEARDAKGSFVQAYFGKRDPTLNDLKEKWDTLGGDHTHEKWWLKAAALCQLTGIPFLPHTVTGRKLPDGFTEGLTSFRQDPPPAGPAPAPQPPQGGGGAANGAPGAPPAAPQPAQPKQRFYSLIGFIRHQYDLVPAAKQALYVAAVNAALEKARAKYHAVDGDDLPAVPPDGAVDGRGGHQPTYAEDSALLWSMDAPAGLNLRGFNPHGPIIPGLPILAWSAWVAAGLFLPQERQDMVVNVNYWRHIWNTDPGLEPPVKEMTIGDVTYTFLALSLWALWAAVDDWTARSTGRSLNATVIAEWMSTLSDDVKFSAIGALVSLQFAGIQNTELHSDTAVLFRQYFQTLKARQTVAIDLWPSAVRYWVIRFSDTCQFNRVAQPYTISDPYWMNSPLTTKLFVTDLEKSDFIRNVEAQSMAAMQRGLNPGPVLTSARVSGLLDYNEDGFPDWAHGFLNRDTGERLAALAARQAGHGLFH